MPPKIRQLKASLWKAGFDSRPGKGSHVVFRHPLAPAMEVTIAGQDGDDADKYQLKQVRNALSYIDDKKSKSASQRMKGAMMEAVHYSMHIQWDEDDQIFVVLVPELPGCATHGKTYEEAVQQGKDAIESWLMVAKEFGDPIPQPYTYAA